MVNKQNDRTSQIITILVVVIVLAFVVIMVRESQQNRLTPNPTVGQSQNQLESTKTNPSEMVLPVVTAGVSPESNVTSNNVYYLPQDVTMELVSDITKNPGGAIITLTNGQKLTVSNAELDQMDPKIKLYINYDLEKGTLQ